MNTKLVVKVCTICGDTANGRNYGALTCESCKCFFRRAVTSKRVSLRVDRRLSNTVCVRSLIGNQNVLDVCHFASKCVINQRSRKCCKKCRFDKCLEAGMKRELVLPGIRSQHESDDNGSHHPNDTHDSWPSDHSDSDILGDNDSKSEMLSLNNSLRLNTSDITDEDISEAIRQIEDFVSQSTTNCDSGSETATSLVPIDKPIATFDKPFNDIELNRIEELSRAFNEFHDHRQGVSQLKIQFRDVIQLHRVLNDLRMKDQLALSAIKFCRKMSLFTSMCEQDRLALFKNSCFKMVCLRYLPTYNLNDGSFTYSITDHYSLVCNMNMFQHFQEYGNPSERVISKWIHDNTIVRLLMALILFHYDRPNLVHSHSVKLNQQIYLYLLQRYLTQKFGSEDISMKKLTKLMTIVKELDRYYLANVDSYKNHAISYTPLVREIYDF